MILLAVSTSSAQDVDNTTIELNTSDVNIAYAGQDYQASLFDNTTPVENETLIFSVNGVDYNKTTNGEGIASLSINLDPGVYNITTTFEKASIVNVNKLYVSYTEGTIITNNMTNEDIQSVIDSSSNLIFVDKSYSDISLVISNASVKLISIVNSNLIGNGADPVIRVSSGASIENFVISRGSILVENANNTRIINNILSDELRIINSSNTNISYNTISNSKSNGIYVKDSANTTIFSNIIGGNNNGIYFLNVTGVDMQKNSIINSKNVGVYFKSYASDINAEYNLINSNWDGMTIDAYVGEVFNVVNNTLERNTNEGLNFIEGYEVDDKNRLLNITDNAISLNGGFNIRGKDAPDGFIPIKIGANYIEADDSSEAYRKVCPRVNVKSRDLTITQIGGNQLQLSVGNVATPFDVKYSLNGGKYWSYATLINGSAVIDVNNTDGSVKFEYYTSDRAQTVKLENYVAPSVPQETPAETPADNTQPQQTPDSTQTNNTSSGNGTANQNTTVSGNGTVTQNTTVTGNTSSVQNTTVEPQNSTFETNSTTTNTPEEQSVPESISQLIDEIATAVSEAIASQTQAAESASSEDVSKTSSDSTPSSVSKKIDIDDEVIRVAGTGIVILLMVMAIVFYYRDDIKYMLSKRDGNA